MVSLGTHTIFEYTLSNIDSVYGSVVSSRQAQVPLNVSRDFDNTNMFPFCNGWYKFGFKINVLICIIYETLSRGKNSIAKFSFKIFHCVDFLIGEVEKVSIAG